MQRDAYAVIQAAVGRTGVREYPARRVESYAFETAVDNDTDVFSLDLGDSQNQLNFLLGRDVEVRASIFLTDLKGTMHRVFTGIGDIEAKDTDDYVLSIQGRDVSSLALGDVPPDKWRHVKPQHFIRERARALGLNNTRIHKMSEIGRLTTDGSETEWALWYRIAREKGMWMWTEPDGTLVVDKLGYGLSAKYTIGHSRPGQGNFIQPTRVSIVKDASGRVGQVWVYGEDAKSKQPFAGRSVDTAIRSWRRKPLRIVVSGDVKSQKDAKTQADEAVFESLVGVREIEVTIRDQGMLVKQNTMIAVRLPELELDGTFYVVGVRVEGGAGGMVQTLRLRERGFAVSKRVPDAPVLNEGDTADNVIPASIASQLSSMGESVGVKWADSFVRATREFGVPDGWDFAVFLGVLLAICRKESNFLNRRGIVAGYINAESWVPWDSFVGENTRVATNERNRYERTYANEREHPYNPRGSSSNTAVGPMQLVSDGYIKWADDYGWNGRAKPGQFEGGRWNPDSNIRAAARALVEKLNYPPKASPLNPAAIWIGVERYYGHPDAAERARYVNDVKGHYEQTFKSMVEGSVLSGTTLPPGTQTKVTIPGYGPWQAPANTPDVVKKAINFCLKRLGDPYEWGGGGPNYDCSSLVTAAYAAASTTLRDKLDEPRGAGRHGETTHTLFTKGRFPEVPRDLLLPGDLLFFNTAGQISHMGMYLSDNMMIHTHRTGHPVHFDSLAGYYGDRFAGARRLVDWAQYGRDT